MSAHESETMGDQKLVDSVIYLASLASELKEIDPKLNKLRGITANWDRTTPLGPDSVNSLHKLIAELKDYLIHRDPLRSFTPESLDERLDDELSGNLRKLPSFVTLLVACLVFSAIMAISPLHLFGQRREFIVIATFLVSLVSVSGWLYLSSFRNFKPELRSVFLYLCAASLFIGMHFVDYLISGWLQWNDRSLFRYGGLTETPALAVIVLYAGLAKYASILKIATKYAKTQLAVSTAVIIGLAVLITLFRGLPDKFYFGLSLASILLVGYYAFVGGRVARLILNNVTASYAKSLRLLYFFELMLPVIALIWAVAIIWLGKIPIGALSVLLAACGSPAMILFMYSGYSFKKATSR